ncbi:competence factor transport accessory protein ComB [Weissella beninensis]|uniref:HlyD family secretion protein n=1 Tax=Periweissella beninensis TaxID=504936 RepID=A0ABT0VIE8_9LACO|nr:HlyD family secretion protein [Periweissella beninensis]MBM7545040.1 competence factor transport accessory protein ComB [Periweissella beninensis]MCM2437164.1 HlyD family secretion protein [Periweissella beninensis]
MVDPKYLESGEFYQRRYRNFPTLIIVPIFLLVVFSILFSLFTKREIVVKASGEIIPAKVLSDIQSTSNNAIDSNQLAENKVVKKGDTLVTFTNSNEKISAQLLNQQINKLNDRLQSLNTYKQSIVNGRSEFCGTDQFGYNSLFNGYIAQVDTLTSEFNQQSSDKQTADQQANHQIDVLKQGRSKNNQQLSNYQAILTSIKNNTKPTNNPYQPIYDNYAAQLKSAQTTDEKEQVKQTALSNVQQQIDQLETTSSSYDSQIAGISKSGPLSKSSTLDKITGLKQQQLASVQKEINDQQQSLDELKAKLSSVNEDYQDTVIKSPEDGILHLATDKTKIKYVPKGTTIAQIYPKLTQQTALNVEYYVSAGNIIGLKQGQAIRFVANQNVTKPLILNGKIKTISSAPITSKEGSFYKLVADINATPTEREQIKYGINGRITTIKGTKTWFNYYKDILLGENN